MSGRACGMRLTCCQPCWHCCLQSDPKKFPKGDPNDCVGGPGGLGLPGHGSRALTECHPRLPEAEGTEVKFQASQDDEPSLTVTHTPVDVRDGSDQRGAGGIAPPSVHGHVSV